MNLLYLTILPPLFGFLLLAFSRGRWSENVSAIIGVGSVGLAALVTFWLAINFCANNADGGYAYRQTLWHWIVVGDFNIPITLVLDALSLIMLAVVTNVGFLIHLYASWYMRGKEGYSRFFTYTNLFITSMVVLVLADNMMLMYLGWEGVGLCSYLLIGFYYTNPENGKAAMKAFFVTRIGDVFLAIGMFILYNQFGTLNFHQLSILLPQQISVGSSLINWATLMILGGAVGKSAQLPLQTWLADAMAGPTPVSALIHAATMVTAGVYLIARTHSLFLLAPEILHLVAIIGAVTLILAVFAALVQTDIKRVLAYSTMSQVGYMFLALGVQAWDAAIFHLMTHAFFKALLFLSAGSVIVACHHEQNIFEMGGLRKTLPFVYGCFLIGGGALAAIPLVTAGFYSKDDILWGTALQGETVLLWAGIVGAFMTALYTFRMIFIVFHGKKQISAQTVGGISHTLPLAVLAVLSTVIGAQIVQPLVGIFPVNETINESRKVRLEIISAIVALLGLVLAVFLYMGKRKVVKSIAKSAVGRFFTVWWYQAWGFDQLYNLIFVKSFKAIAQLLANNPVNSSMNIPAVMSHWGNKGLTFSQNGQIRWYLASMGLGAVLMLTLLLLV
ncbi:NADH-quinone oxidoreductase subunit L [Arsenophonus endosymbiont of Aleurodicus floccissimus]|uniref:NADH-quinone oxidoreductase subunit L n=1 Tax=Arsenophonus endosymbiont of Aleurodicus floccissimus TaxID=2152761 RepID=UPI000E6B009B|nr:NADH-quinone oxidoreductase subunit L [Arsenophonus endosymbiont of Aleurodicus floccissimus]SPP31454.1 NADH-quinone oxidoreductase subunit L [Arsenophonus endosymbiont of Aleurodicus floccissimus]